MSIWNKKNNEYINNSLKRNKWTQKLWYEQVGPDGDWALYYIIHKKINLFWESLIKEANMKYMEQTMQIKTFNKR